MVSSRSFLVNRSNFNLLLYSFCLSFVFAFAPLCGFDLWWHIAGGAWAIEHFQIPRVDPFSYTFPGVPWIHHEWGSGVVYVLVMAVAGLRGLIILKTLLVAGYLFFAGKIWQILKKSPQIPFFTLLLLAWFASPRFVLRPHIFSNLFLALLLYGLCRYFFDESCRRSRLLWGIPLLFVVWANLHWGALLGWGLFFFFWLAVVIKSRSFLPARPLFFSVVVSALALLINPFHEKIYTFPFEHLAMQEILNYTTEWHSPFLPPFRETPQFWIYLFILGTTLFWSLACWIPRRKLEILFVMAPLAYLSLKYFRYVDLFALWAIPCMTVEAGRFLAEKMKMNWPGPKIRIAGVLVSLAVLYSLNLAKMPNTALIHPACDFFKATSFLKQNLPNEKIMNTLELGGYLMLEGYPVFFDGRTPMYGEEFFMENLRLLHEPDFFEQMHQKWDFGVVFLPRFHSEFPLFGYLAVHPHWSLIYADDISVIFVDHRSSHQALVHPPEKPRPAQSP